jgi:hypothetical protein
MKIRTVLPEGRHKEISKADGNILYLDLGDGYVDTYICQNSMWHRLGICVSYCK